jgi:hypothetical protein
VARLHKRRDEITRELGQLSGVIQALAVPGAQIPAQATQQAHGDDAPQTAQPQEEDAST